MGKERLAFSPLVGVRRLPGIGRDLVALQPAPTGAWLTRDPVIELDVEQCAIVDQGLVGEFYLRHPTRTGWGCLALGLTSLVNHADRPNAKLSWYETEEAGWVVGLEALREIAVGESVTLDYDYPLWFEARPTPSA